MNVNYEAAFKKARELLVLPYSARVSDYIDDGMTDEARKRALQGLREADEEADKANREIIVAIVDAALEEAE